MSRILEKLSFILSIGKNNESVNMSKSVLFKVIGWAEEKDSSNSILNKMRDKLFENQQSDFTCVSIEDLSFLMRDLQFTGPVSVHTLLYQY